MSYRKNYDEKMTLLKGTLLTALCIGIVHGVLLLKEKILFHHYSRQNLQYNEEVVAYDILIMNGLDEIAQSILATGN